MRRIRICPAKGFTLVEITLVLGLLLLLATMSLASAGWFAKMGAARKAEAVLRQVENARVSWLIDNPQKNYADVSISVIKPYLPDPKAIDKLATYGYTLSDADLQKEDITYGTKKDALPIPGYVPKK